VDGKKKFIRKTIRPDDDKPLTLAQAKEIFRELYVDTKRRKVDPGKTTVAEYLDFWLNTYIRGQKKPRTVRWYEMNVSLYLKPNLGHIRLGELSAHDVKKALNEISEKPTRTGGKRTKEAVEGVHRTLSAALEMAIGEKLEYNVAKFKAAKPERSTRAEKQNKRQIFNSEQATLFLDQAKQRYENSPKRYQYDRFVQYATFATALFTCARKGEILALKWDKVDLKKKVIQYHYALSPDDELDTVKTGESHREVRMLGPLIEVLSELQKRQKEAFLKAGLNWKELKKKDIFVFSQANNLPLEYDVLTSRHLKTVINLANEQQKKDKKDEIPVLSFHELRHSTATILLELGVDPVIVADICGHYDAAFTKRQYGHTKVRLQDDAMDKLEKEYLAKLEEIRLLKELRAKREQKIAP
jgi:integrase